MGKKPDKSYSIERLDVNRGYEPENCVWATKETQSRNKTSSVKLTIDGETKCASEWALDPRCTVDVSTIHKRVRRGMPHDEAVFRKAGE